MSKSKPRLVVEVAHLPVTFHALSHHIVAVLQIGEDQTIGLRFESVEHLLTFCTELIEKAAVTWPDHPLIREYKE